MMGKLGGKSLHLSKLGAKNIHSVAKFGNKMIAPATTVASILAPEAALGLTVAGMVAKPVLKTLERDTR